MPRRGEVEGGRREKGEDSESEREREKKRERERGIQVIIPDDEIRLAILQEIGTALPSFVNVTILYQNYCCLGAAIALVGRRYPCIKLLVVPVIPLRLIEVNF